jgi:hypothetical protein
VLKFLLVILVFALLVYGVLRMLDLRRTGGSAGPGRRGPTAKPQRRVVAPDDDEDFLRGLDRRRKRTGDSDGGGDSPA